MMKLNSILIAAGIIGASTVSALSAPLQQETNPADAMSELVKQAKDYGYTHVTELEFDDNSRLEVKGWLEDNWFAETEFGTGDQVLKEEKQRKIVQPWGLSFTQVDALVKQAEAQGIVTIEEIEVDDSGRIEVDGEDQQGRDIDFAVLFDQLGE